MKSLLEFINLLWGEIKDKGKWLVSKFLNVVFVKKVKNKDGEVRSFMSVFD